MTRAGFPALDEAVRTAALEIERRAVAAPEVLFLMATGVHLFMERFEERAELPLGDIPGVLEPWDGEVLHTGRLGGLRAWALDDVSGEPGSGESPPWSLGYPIWLASACGASLSVHTSAGCNVSSPPALPIGGFALVRDHLNLSGRTPLLAIGESRLGPLFPDQSLLHHGLLRRAALARAAALGLSAAEAVAACTAGPALETRSERAMFARLGAEVAVQSLASPLLACAHAGLPVLAIVLVTDDGESPVQVARLLERAERSLPALEDLLFALVPDLEREVAALAAQRAR